MAILVSTFLAACGGKEPSAPPPPNATFSKPLVRNVVEWDQFPGRLESPQTVTLSPRVSGIIEQAPFVEGSIVNKGDTLFVLDERPFKAAFLRAEADVARAQSQLAVASANARRYEKLQGTKAISAENYDAVQAALKQAKADVAAAEAAREVAKLNLEWTRVTAPITGKVGRKAVTEGNLVTGGAGQPSELTTITSMDPMFVYATIPERSLIRYRSVITDNQAVDPSYRLPCAVQLENETGFERRGVIDFFGNQVNPTTGTIEVRGVIPNSDGKLTAGLFARLRIQGTGSYEGILIPDNAVGADQNSRYVLTIGADDLIEYRPVKLGARFGSLRAIVEGISPTDRIIVTGIQQLRPKTKVAPKETDIDEASLTMMQPPAAGASR